MVLSAKPSLEEVLSEALDRFSNQLIELNDYLRQRERQVVLMRMKRVHFSAAEVNTWKKALDPNQYRIGFSVDAVTFGVVRMAPSRPGTATDGLSLFTNNQIFPHHGELWVLTDVVDNELNIAEFIRTPLTPKQV